MPMGVAEDTALRELIMHRLATRVAESGGFLSRAELSDFDLGNGLRRRLIDTSKGIWNPRDLNATLSILSSPNGPYDDTEVEGACSATTTAPDLSRATTPSCGAPANSGCH